MTDCRYIDARLLDWLYGELPSPERVSIAEHLRGCAGCREISASLSWVRALMRSLPEEEPPGAISARLLREAAREALGTRSGASRPLWQRLRAWLAQGFQLAWANPAMAAMATLVLVAGVAGALRVRGALEPAETRVAAPSSRSADEAVDTVSVWGARENAPGVAQEREPARAEAAETEMAAAGVVEETKDKARARSGLGAPAEAPDKARRQVRKKSAPVRRSVEKSAGRPADELVERDRKAPNASRRALGRLAAGLGGGALADPEAGPAAGSASETASPAAPEPVAAAGDVATEDAAEDADDVREAREDRAPARAERLYASLRLALSDRRCARAIRIAGDLRELDSAYYRRHVAGDRVLDACARAERARAKRVAEGQAAKKAADKADDEAADKAAAQPAEEK